jgi:hypothetical protein
LQYHDHLFRFSTIDRVMLRITGPVKVDLAAQIRLSQVASNEVMFLSSD